MSVDNFERESGQTFVQRSGLKAIMNSVVYALFAAAMASWVVWIAYPAGEVPFGWIGILFGSAAGLIATVLSYLTEEKVDTRAGVIFKSESPIKFLLAYAIFGVFLLGCAFASVLGVLGSTGCLWQ